MNVRAGRSREDEILHGEERKELEQEDSKNKNKKRIMDNSPLEATKDFDLK